MARILVVDDDDDFRSVVRRLLEREGYDVAEVPDGSVALGEYRERPADLIIMDVYMPGTDGIEAIIRLRHEFPDARIIATSGGGYMNHAEVLDMASRLGAQRTLTKPIAREELLDAVQHVLTGEA